MNTIKIVFLLPNISGGGAEKVVTTLINSLDRNKFSTTLVLLTNSNRPEYDVAADNIIRLKKKRILYTFLSLRRLMINLSPDIVFTTITYVNCFYGLIHFSLFPNKVKWICRESTIPSIIEASLFIKFIYKALIFFSYRQANRIICQSKDMEEDLLKIHNFKNIHSISNPVLFSSNDVKKYEPRQGLCFLTIAMLRQEKGIERVLDALALSKRDDYTYIIVGDGPQQTYLRSYATRLGILDKVSFKGYSAQPWDFISSYSSVVFLQGSYYEGFPNVLLEACSRGIPVIAYDCPGGTREIIRNSFNGFIVKTRSEYSSKLKNCHLYNFDSNAIRQDINSRFSLNEIVKKYEQIFTQLN
ncbi:MAG: glycosyltransferase [Chitinophagaceae bacterium]